MRDFGSLLIVPSMMHFGEKAGPTTKATFVPGLTFRDAIAATLDLLASPDFAAEFDLKEHVGDEGPGDDPEIAPVIDVTIIDTFLQAELSFNDSHFHFFHPSLVTALSLLSENLQDDSGRAHESIAEANTVTSHYRSAIRSERTVEIASLLPIAELLHGRSFVSLLNERFDREAAHAET
ncbi:hypothetical protein EN852_025610 [Mesorhizobium sp. M2E.F.Ca.ET.209.01.1.1]|uniref:hypothetical protein n=1 Tax=Mesorhizobium sp. M2E.F.Ca.ET.209.01.1.1 TaxID=2500526 RepID=UPI000FD9714F|nr:hypothetical protein [Mesorhizobium sp. M2E.F.Ca.ET.209.01.1.1]TGS10526.1 hypothetical protein EN852_025610 [Mesorhizobium sp. M2E.F.Ca.ET.209.01.1.1]